MRKLASSTRFRTLLTLLAIVFLGTVPFFPSLAGGWLGDDSHLVVQAECARSFEDILAILQQDAGQCNYRPARYISYAVDHLIWGLTPSGYRITNLALHAVSSLLVFGLARRVGLRTPIAFLATALWSLHPVQADTVAYISGRRDLLCGVGYFGAVLSAFGLANENYVLKRRVAFAALLALAATLSVTSKEMGVTLAPIVLVLLAGGGQQFFDDQELSLDQIMTRLRRYWLPLVTVSATCAAVFIHRGIRKPVSTVTGQLFGGSLETHVATILSVHARYVEMIFIPLRLTGDYAPPVISIPDSIVHPPSLLGGAWLLLLGLSCIYFIKKRLVRAAFGVSWYVTTMLPVSHIIPHHELAAEHYLYIPLVGLLIASGSLLQHYVDEGSHRRRVVSWGVAALILAIGSTLTWKRSSEYRSELTHARATVEHAPSSIRGRARLGVALLERGRFESAKEHLSIVLASDFQGSARLDALRELGRYHLEQENWALAQKALGEYMSYQSGDLRGLRMLGKTYFAQNELEQAAMVNQRILAEVPRNEQALYNLAMIRFRQGDTKAAGRLLRRAYDVAPDNPQILLLGARVHLELNRPETEAFLNSASRQATEPRQARLIQSIREAWKKQQSENPAEDDDVERP